VRRRLALGILVVWLALAAPVAGQFDGPQLTPAGEPPVEGQFEEGVAELGVTIRNDSGAEGTLTPRLILDDGTTVEVEPAGVESDGTTYTLSVVSENLDVQPRGVVRLRLELRADPVPEEAVTGTLVVDPPGRRVAALAVPFSIAPPAAVPSRFAKAAVEPAKATMVVRRWLPSWVHAGDADETLNGSADASVTGVAAADEASDAVSRSVAIAGDTGGRGTLDVELPELAATATSTTLSVEPVEIDRRGAYEATIPLDPEQDESPALELKVTVGDHWMWPLLALLAGAGVGYRVVGMRERTRPKRVLQLALTQAQHRHVANAAAVDAKQLVKPYTLGAMFPSGKWDWSVTPRTEAVDLFCRIDEAPTQEQLDVLADEVTDLEKRASAWPSVCAKAHALKEATAKLGDRPHAANMRDASTALFEKPAVPGDEAAVKAYMKSLDEQVAAIREWLAADALFEEAKRLFTELSYPPRRHDPARWRPDLAAATSLDDLERCRVVRELCRDVHVLRTLVIQRDPDARKEMLGEVAPGAEAAEVPKPSVSIKAPPPALEGPALTRYLKATIAAADRWALAITFTVAALAYLLTVYSDTYGSVVQYLTAFAAGAGATFAASWKLLPWYTTFKRPK
jgi:hypothetical protein